MDLGGIIRGISIWAIPLVLAVVLHEVAHGLVADKFGDPTARLMGRLTLNPLKHVDPVGTILVPILLLAVGSPILFGYAKPVPIDFHRLRHPKKDMVWVALAGPATNILLAVASAVLLYGAVRLPAGLHWFANPAALMLQASILINLVLCFFNLIPLPPLDGGRVAVGLLPHPASHYLARLEPYGFMIIVVLLLTGVLQALIAPPIMAISQGLMSWAMGH